MRLRPLALFWCFVVLLAALWLLKYGGVAVWWSPTLEVLGVVAILVYALGATGHVK